MSGQPSQDAYQRAALDYSVRFWARSQKNYWDHTTGKLNVYAIVQAATEGEKRKVYDFLRDYFGDA